MELRLPPLGVDEEKAKFSVIKALATIVLAINSSLLYLIGADSKWSGKP